MLRFEKPRKKKCVVLNGAFVDPLDMIDLQDHQHFEER
jgi:hypothetical protein